MAKKEDTKKVVKRMLKTSRTFKSDDYAEFIILCNKQITIRKPKEEALNAANKEKKERKAALEMQKAEIEKELQDIAKQLKEKNTKKRARKPKELTN
jgi:hypothetical protein